MRHDQAGLLGQRDELGRRDQAALADASQRTSASTLDDAAGREVDDRLVVRAEARSRSRAWRRSASSSSRSDALVVMLGSKTAMRALPLRLGLVHRHIGVAQQRLGRSRPALLQGDADAARVTDSSRAVESERRAAGSSTHAARRPRHGVSASSTSSSRTANSSPPRRASGVVGAQAALRRRSATVDEQPVAGGVAEAVVDDLEVVEVQEQHGHRIVARRSGQRVLDGWRRAAVGQTGERIVGGLVGDPRRLCARASPAR